MAALERKNRREILLPLQHSGHQPDSADFSMPRLGSMAGAPASRGILADAEIDPATYPATRRIKGTTLHLPVVINADPGVLC